MKTKQVTLIERSSLPDWIIDWINMVKPCNNRLEYFTVPFYMDPEDKVEERVIDYFMQHGVDIDNFIIET